MPESSGLAIRQVHKTITQAGRARVSASISAGLTLKHWADQNTARKGRGRKEGTTEGPPLSRHGKKPQAGRASPILCGEQSWQGQDLGTNRQRRNPGVRQEDQVLVHAHEHDKRIQDQGTHAFLSDAGGKALKAIESRVSRPVRQAGVGRDARDRAVDDQLFSQTKHPFPHSRSPAVAREKQGATRDNLNPSVRNLNSQEIVNNVSTLRAEAQCCKGSVGSDHGGHWRVGHGINGSSTPSGTPPGRESRTG